MSERTEELLSVWLDDELDENESELVVRRLARHQELRQTVARYCLIGDAVRGELVTPRALELGHRISAVLEQEPAVRSETPARVAGWRRPLAGAAVAASVAVAAVLGLRSTDFNSAVEIAPIAGIDETSPVPGYSVPVPLTRRAGAPDRLSSYYLNHSEYATMLRGQGSLVRMISVPTADTDALEQDVDREQAEPDADIQ
ncbi:MAG: sigma-E factor negative regulatory protein [Gammaproteobacteria bacterium]